VSTAPPEKNGGSGAVGADVAAAVLAGLPDVTAARLRRLLAVWPDPTDALAAVRKGEAARALVGLRDPDAPARLARTWRGATTDDLVARMAAMVAERGTRAYVATDTDSPIDPDSIPDHPALLLAEGDCTTTFDAPRVAIVGTRAATPHGLDDARRLGAELAESGVTIVSGMAIGIDAAAHEGALAARGSAVGVVATGLDIEYPRRHRALYGRVRDAGVIVSELGFGVRPAPERFPVRNRIIAALADVTVVVEATARGGARITAEHAVRYGRHVLAVPGSRRNAAAEGCNELIRDGALPLLHTDDVLLALGWTPGARRGGTAATTSPARAALTGDAAALHRAFGGEPATIDQLATRTGLAVAAVAEALCVLRRDGWASSESGRWWPA
jgi:DNA processing protein